MFYGLNNWLKKILPKKLFYRSLIIIVAPLIIMQIIIVTVFFDSLWIKTNKAMMRSLAGELQTIFDFYNKNDEKNNKLITELYNKNFDFEVIFKDKEILPEKKTERWFSPIDRSLRRELKPIFGHSYWFDTTAYKELVEIRIKYKTGILQVLLPKEKIAPSSFRIFALWLTLPGLILVFIALIFLKNQTRPIINLAKLAEKFGKGESIKEFRPSGAQEIRQAAYEFERMRKRITKHLNQRSEMLSGISHDLRTPLTRLKLQLAFLKDEKIIKKMSDDIDEMEKMLNEYLQFASFQKNDKTEKINLKNLIKNVVEKYDNKNIAILLDNDQTIEVDGRHNALKRCLINLLDNALSFGKNIKISLKKTLNNVVIFVEDDGPGIPQNEIQNVFKPFYKVDKSRSQNRSGVGLGLSIANDIVQAHGGSIYLDKSPMKGLRAKITLPF